MSSLWPVSGDAAEITELLRAWESADDEPAPLVIATSGSTGEPKRVQLSRRAMRASADATHARLGGPGRWELNLPPTYVAGVQVLFRTIRAGEAAGRRYVSLVPTQLVRQREDWPSLAAYDAVLIGGGPLDPHVRADAEAAGVPIVQTYGMSETCGGCVYDGVPLDGVEIRIDGDDVLLRGPMLFDGYEGDPERTAAAYRDGWLVTNDLGHVGDDGRLRIDGRADDVIISGGLKIPAVAVAQLLRRLSFFDDLEVVGAPDEEWGEAVVCVMVGGPSDLTDEQKDEILRLRAEFPDRAWWPKHFVAVDEIPRLPNGKPDRVALKKLAADD